MIHSPETMAEMIEALAARIARFESPPSIPVIQWHSDCALRAGVPEPHIRLQPEYMEQGDDDEREVAAWSLFQFGIDQGTRLTHERMTERTKSRDRAVRTLIEHVQAGNWKRAKRWAELVAGDFPEDEA